MNNTCATCKFWQKESVIDTRFGKCLCHNTFSWVRGQSFEPPNYFGCINHETRLVFSTKDKNWNIDIQNEPTT